MDKKKVVVMLDNGHGSNTPGKCSPIMYDGRQLKEYAYAREIVSRIQEILECEGYNVFIVTPELRDISLANRVKRINEKYTELKKKGMTGFMISVHCNASGNGLWMKANGWSAWTSIGLTKGDILADYLYNAAEDVLKPLKKNIRYLWNDGDADYENAFYILKNTNCPATLTENMFMDNRDDCEWLLSEEGMFSITQLHVIGIKSYIESL